MAARAAAAATAATAAMAARAGLVARGGNGKLLFYAPGDGGNGGNGGAGGPGGEGGEGGNGGSGGAGVTLNVAALYNTGQITGGNGGAGGAGGSFGLAGTPGGGGAGGSGGTLGSETAASGATGDKGASGTLGASGAAGQSGAGGVGVYLTSSTLITSGSISGGTSGLGVRSDAVQFGPIASTLVVEPGASFFGQIAASSTVNDTLEVSGHQSGGTGITLGSQFTGFSSLYFSTGSMWTVDAGPGAALSSGTTVAGFSAGDTIDITNQASTQIRTDFGVPTVSLGGGKYEFLGGRTGETLTTPGDGVFKFQGNFSGDYFVLTPDGSRGTDITLAPVCYLRGTRILTPTGEVLVESLKRGDRVVTRFGGLQRIKWIGRQSYRGAAVADNREHLPVRLRAGSLGEGLPARDLYVSPGHSMLVDDTLVLARSLVNGITITQDPCRERIDYFQIELEGHDCVIAEGTWSETYADWEEGRNLFHNAAEFHALFPDHRARCAGLSIGFEATGSSTAGRTMRPTRSCRCCSRSCSRARSSARCWRVISALIC